MRWHQTICLSCPLIPTQADDLNTGLKDSIASFHKQATGRILNLILPFFGVSAHETLQPQIESVDDKNSNPDADPSQPVGRHDAYRLYNPNGVPSIGSQLVFPLPK